MKKLIAVSAILALPLLSMAQVADIIDDDGILSIVDTPFDVNRFVIGRDFHENKFTDQDKGLRGMADCYFNMSDASDGEKQNLSLCKKLGLNTIISAKGKHLTGKEWMAMSDKEIDAYIKKMIDDGGKSKAIVGYHICDEPSAMAFPKLAVAVEAVRKYAPGKMATINLYPNYATLWTLDQVKSQLGTRTYKEYLEQAATIIKPDMISYDNYMVQFSMDQSDAKRTAQYYTNIMAVREVSLKYNIPWWNVVSGNQIRHYTTIPTMSNLLLQAYTSLAAGAGGVRWFTYWKGGYAYTPIDGQERRTQTWHYLREVNRQLSILGPIMKHLRSTGVYFTNPAVDPSLPLLPGEHVKHVQCEEPLMIGEFLSEKGNRYIMVVNLSLERSARFVLRTAIDRERLFVVNTGEEHPYFQEIDETRLKSTSMLGGTAEQLAMAKERAYWLPAGAGALIKCSGLTYEK